MKKGIHPENYRPVVFKDMSNGDMFLSKSTAKTNDTVEFEGETYPVVKVEISSTSHPFYTGKSKLVDTAGRNNIHDIVKSLRLGSCICPSALFLPKNLVETQKSRKFVART